MMSRLLDAWRRVFGLSAGTPTVRPRAARLRTILDLRGEEPTRGRRAVAVAVTWPSSWTAPAGDARHPVARPAGERMLPGRVPVPQSP